jgi:hypothetical protein
MNVNPTSYVQLPLGGEINTLQITVDPFVLFPTTISVTWTVTGPSINRQGTLALPQSIVDQWGTDDTIVQNYVLQELNLTLAPETTTTTTEQV